MALSLTMLPLLLFFFPLGMRKFSLSTTRKRIYNELSVYFFFAVLMALAEVISLVRDGVEPSATHATSLTLSPRASHPSIPLELSLP